MFMTQLAHPVLVAKSFQRRPAERRGVLLLVVLGMLAMFGLIGLAFVMLTGHARRGAEALRRKEFYVENPKKFTDEAILQILRGSNNTASVLQNHSLLEDVYGNNTLQGATNGAFDLNGTALTGGTDSTVQLIDIQVAENQTLDFPGIQPSQWPSTELLDELNESDGRLLQSASRGHVLTFTSGPAAGQSVRIVDWRQIAYSMDTGNPYRGVIRIVSPTKIPNTTDTFTINGAPFSGTGFGYNIHAGANDPQLSARMRSWIPETGGGTDQTAAPNANEPVVALLPNPAGFNADDIYNLAAGDNPTTDDLGYDDPSGPGGANEDYDAPDYQNMLMALQLPDGRVPIPSLYRPSLVNYWTNQVQSLPGIGTNVNSTDAMINAKDVVGDMDDASQGLPALLGLKRRVFLRPLIEYHPDFDGSNPNYNPLWDGVTGTGEWDVDNDGDGIKDSIWVDLGLPVQTMKDGRQYKPLVAILCVDLDGRLNLNAHGNLTQAWGVNPDPCAGIIAGPAGGSTPAADRGQGIGVAEVSLVGSATLPGLLTPTELTTLLQGDFTNQIPGRYGADSVNDIANGGLGTPYYTPGNDRLRQTLGLSDGVSPSTFTWNPAYDFASYPYDYTGIAENGLGTTDFSSPIDLKGGMQVSLDWRGQPIYQTVAPQIGNPANIIPVDFSTTTRNDALIAQPYELDLSPTGPHGSSMTSPDAPYSVAELEKLLRPYDVDAMNLPDRLEKLMDPGGTGWWQTNNRNRNVTTESWDIASTPCAVTAADIADLTTAIQGELSNAYDPTRFQRDPNNPDGIAYAPRVKEWLNQFPPGIAQLLVVRLADGGNGMRVTQKTSPNNDSIEELFTTIGNDLLGPELMAGLPLNLNQKLMSNTDRITMARRIYVIAMLLADLDYLDTVAWQVFTDTDPGAGNYGPYTSRLLAQWAVNVVDFRCNDSTMTGFEYDIDPFTDNVTNNGPVPWNVDKILLASSADNGAAYRGLVWGSARPELLITETLAFHNRRVVDSAVDSGDNDDTAGGDADFDQQQKPEAALFVELFNPSSPYTPKEDALYETSGALNTQGIELDARTTNGNTPIWRCLIVRVINNTATNTASSYDGDAFTRDPGDPDEDLRPAIPANPGDTGIVKSVYFVDPGVGVDLGEDGDRLIAAASPATLLPGRYAVMGPSNVVDINQPTAGGTNNRRIELQPDTDNTAGNQIQALNLATPNPTVGTEILNPISIIVPELNVSGPAGGYDPLITAAELATFNGTVFNPPLDQPLDLRRPVNDDIAAMVAETDTWPRAFIIHLQRLANPENQYDADTNPYLTVDSLPIDLITYNGADVDDDAAPGNIKFESRQRGEATTNFTGIGPLWQSRIDEKTTAPSQTQEVGSLYRFPYTLSQTLGFLNEPFGPLLSSPNVPSDYMGSPQTPFPWLNWNNRPYMSKNELLLVPCASSARLLRCYGIDSGVNDYDASTGGTGGAGGTGGTGSTGSTGSTALAQQAEPGGGNTGVNGNGGASHGANNIAAALGNFPHQLNFFNSLSIAGGGTHAAELHRILDYVRVPSRFVKTREPIQDTVFGSFDMETFRDITDQREPGRVNLNTVVGVNAGDNGPIWNGTVGLGAPLVDETQLSTAFTPTDPPTRFPKPFRSPKGLGLVPTSALMNNLDREVNSTLLRENGNVPVFVNEWTADPTDNYHNTDRNPYFRYLPLTRLGNIAGTRSNVYAIWVTVGYFEVEPAVFEDNNNDNLDDTLACTLDEFSRIYPDGVRIGREVGSDSGEVKRNRSFYIIDRSIPVGFKRGMDLNVKDAVLVERDIE